MLNCKDYNRTDLDMDNIHNKICIIIWITMAKAAITVIDAKKYEIYHF